MFNLKNLGDNALKGQLKSINCDLKRLSEVKKFENDEAEAAHKANVEKLQAYLKDLQAEATARNVRYAELAKLKKGKPPQKPKDEKKDKVPEPKE